MVSRIHYDSIPSTQTEAKKHFGELTEKGAWRVYTASSQTQGQGTHGRDWHSPIGNIYASYIFLVPKNIAGTTLPHLAQIGAISVAEVLDNHGVSSTIKWVNDVLINGKKAAGLLPQAETQGDYFGVCMGVGVNVNVELSQLSHIAQPATSVKAETGKELPLDRLIDELSNRIYDNVTRLMREGYAPFQQAMNARLERFGGFPIIFDREVVKEGETPYYVGTITGVGNNGSLLLKEVNGEKQTCITGRILKGREIEPALQNVGVLDSLIVRHIFDQLPSTQLYARDNISDLKDGRWHVVRAKNQTAGIGQGEHRWESPSGNIYATWVIPQAPLSSISRLQLSQIVAYATTEVALRYGIQAEIKWKNDVMVDGAKLAGTLVEFVDSVALIGIGLNVAIAPDTDQQTTALAVVAEEDIDIDDVFTTLNQRLFYAVHVASRFGFETFLPQINNRLAYKGERVTVHADNGEVLHTDIEGDITPEGGLTVGKRVHGDDAIRLRREPL